MALSIATPTPSLVAESDATTLPPSHTQLWPEPLDTPGIIPQHLKRSATADFPVLEVLQRLLYRLRPFGGTGGDLEKALALIGLYQAIRPVYRHLRDFFLWAFTVQISVPESEPLAKEILSWMGSEVVNKSRTRSAMLVAGGSEHASVYINHIRLPGQTAHGDQGNAEILCLPPVGTRLFWYASFCPSYFNCYLQQPRICSCLVFIPKIHRFLFTNPCRIGFRPFLFSRSGGQGYTQAPGFVPGNVVNDRGQLLNALTITTLGWSLTPLRVFTDLCHEFKMKHLTGTTTVFFAGSHHGGYSDGWQSVSKAVRKLDTIDMDEAVKSDVIKDAEYYYSEES